MRKTVEYYLLLENKLDLLLQLLSDKLEQAEKNEIQFFLDATEYGIAFETLCAIVSDAKLDLSPHDFSLILELAEIMSINRERWEPLKALIVKAEKP